MEDTNATHGAIGEMTPEEEDIVLLATKFGAHHPKNGHSFSAQFILLPTACAMCKGSILPLGKAAICLRCRATVHRSCTCHTAQMCPWKFRSHNVERSAIEQWRSLLLKCIDHQRWEQRLHQVDTAKLPMSLYGALWQLCVFDAEADEQEYSPGSLQSQSITSFLSKVSYTLQLRCHRGAQGNSRDVIRTVRCCCDALAEIVLQMLPNSGAVLKSKELLLHIYEVADATVLGNRNAEIYKTVMLAFEQQIPAPPPTTESPGHRRRRSIRSGEVMEAIDRAIVHLVQIPREVTAVQKVRALVRALGALATGEVAADELLQRMSVTLRCPECADINWKGELRFMEEFLGRKDEWLLGEEGYALTTLFVALEGNSS